MPFVGKRWVHQIADYDTERGISYWTKNYRTSIEADDAEALSRNYEYYDPIHTLPEAGQQWWQQHGRLDESASRPPRWPRPPAAPPPSRPTEGPASWGKRTRMAGYRCRCQRLQRLTLQLRLTSTAGMARSPGETRPQPATGRHAHDCDGGILRMINGRRRARQVACLRREALALGSTTAPSLGWSDGTGYVCVTAPTSRQTIWANLALWSPPGSARAV